jgi:uncharacterized protein YPO0396
MYLVLNDWRLDEIVAAFEMNESQLMTPLQKIAVIEDYIAAVHFVHNEGGSNSVVQTLTIEEYRERKSHFLAAAATLTSSA